MTLESGKTLGGVGAILLVVGTFVPLLGLVGIILVLIGLKNLAEYYKEDSIYRDALYGFIFGIIGIVALALVLVAFLFGGSIFGFTIVTSGDWLAILGAVIVILVVAFIFSILETIYFKRAFDSLADKSGENLFHTAGLLLLIGAVLTIIVVGIVITFIAWIIAIVAFFSIKTPTTPTQPPPPTPPPQTA